MERMNILPETKDINNQFDRRTVSFVYDIITTQTELWEKENPKIKLIEGMKMAQSIIFDILMTLDASKEKFKGDKNE
jgi:hypothetical protein